MIIRSKCVFDSIHDEPFDGYVVIEGNRIRQVGCGEPDAAALQGQEVMDCGDKTVIPGFCDDHVHMFLGGLDLTTCNLAWTESEEEAARRLYEFYKDRDDEWVIGFGWSNFDWEGFRLPSKETLDRYFPDRPVAAANDELHALWVNSAALKRAGITRDTQDPPYSHIEKDADGEPTGYILEQDAMRLVTDEAFSRSDAEEKAIIRAFMKNASARGVTSVGEMEITGVQKTEMYDMLEKAGELDLRIFFSQSIRTPVEELLRLRSTYHSDQLSMLAAKGFIDGTPLGHTGLMIEDYSDLPGSRGGAVLDLAWLKERIIELNCKGIPVRLHACGDGAVREALTDILEAQKLGADRSLRNTVEHIECIHPDDLDLFAQTGTVASIQPYHMVMDSYEEHPVFSILGEERSRLAWPARTLMEHGAHVALGTDCPIVPLDPMQTIYCAVNRLMEDGTPAGGWNPQEKLTLAEAIKGCTAECAYLFGMEGKTGVLKEGALADIVVLSGNIFKTDPEDIRDVQPETTIFDGRIVFSKEDCNE